MTTILRQAQLKNISPRIKVFGTPSPLWRTCMMRVLQVEKSGPIFLPVLLLFLELLLVVPEPVKCVLCWETFLKPHLPQKHVQREGSHHETRIEGESGSHAGPGASLTFNLAGAE